MPSPLAHILGGGVVYLAGTSAKQRSWLVLGATMLGSIVPDFDFLPGFLIGNPSAFHHGISHSSGFALLYGTVVFLVLRYSRHSDIATRAALMATFSYAFHAVLDAVSVGEGAKAVPLLWPFSPQEFGINLDLFGHFHHDGLADGIWSVVRRENLPALARELTVMGATLLLLLLWRSRGDRSKTVRVVQQGENS
ncbi:MAG TPA: metal-dependent hydrolase [Candidatus Binatia bacterium]|nr:metal-dependent hydrolase [Candidatus Binatia bacterium]